MLDINDLEKRWLHYKIKSYIPHTIILLSLIIISSIFILFLPSTSIQNTPITIKQVIKSPTLPKPITQVNVKPIIKQTPIKKKPQPRIIVKKEQTLKLKPSLGFMNKMQNSTQPYYNENQENMLLTQNTDTDKAPVKQKKKIQEEAIDQEIEIVEEVVVQPAKKVSIKRRNTKDDIAEIIKRFKKNNNPALSLFVAKKYYELGDYHQSYNYALITNNINSEIEQSWIIFAKSLVKLNEKNMAIKTLKSYIQSSHSSSAQILLEEITSGKFQ